MFKHVIDNIGDFAQNLHRFGQNYEISYGFGNYREKLKKNQEILHEFGRVLFFFENKFNKS